MRAALQQMPADSKRHAQKYSRRHPQEFAGFDVA
jgi:hypothetical protein